MEKQPTTQEDTKEAWAAGYEAIQQQDVFVGLDHFLVDTIPADSLNPAELIFIKRIEGPKDIVYYTLKLTPAGPKRYVFEHFDLAGDDNEYKEYGSEDSDTLEILGWVAKSVREARERPHKTQVNTKLIWDTAPGSYCSTKTFHLPGLYRY